MPMQSRVKVYLIAQTRCACSEMRSRRSLFISPFPARLLRQFVLRPTHLSCFIISEPLADCSKLTTQSANKEAVSNVTRCGRLLHCHTPHCAVHACSVCVSHLFFLGDSVSLPDSRPVLQLLDPPLHVRELGAFELVTVLSRAHRVQHTISHDGRRERGRASAHWTSQHCLALSSLKSLRVPASVVCALCECECEVVSDRFEEVVHPGQYGHVSDGVVRPGHVRVLCELLVQHGDDTLSFC